MVTETIDGESYTFQYLNTSDALEIAGEVAQKLIPVLGKLAGTGNADTDLADLKIEQVAGALAASLEPKRMQELIKKLCTVVFKNPGGVINFEEDFRGRPGHALKVARKSFEVNCGDFFESAASLAGISLKGTTQDPSKLTG